MGDVRVVQDGNLLVYYDEKDTIVYVDEILTDAECDRYAVEVMNGDGYYNSDGNFVRYSGGDD